MSCSPVITSSTTTGTVQPPSAECRKPTTSGPVVATRYPTLCANPESDAATRGSGDRAMVKKIARPSEAPWPRPSTSTQATSLPSGANQAPARPAALAATVPAISACWFRARCARTGISSEPAAPPTPVRASSVPAAPALTPRSRSMVGSQDSSA